ncbi:MAG: iron export ABC transporter permease subunit FetB [Proteobacteria bacterium]|nr:iron export ABC transporter permease subunit FetB [Pseudomonadota bacterium]
MSGPLPISATQLALAAALVGINGLLSLWLGLGLGKKLVIASLRAVVQLTILGLILVPVFAANHPGVVAVLVVFMLAIAGREAVGRTKRTTKTLPLAATAALLIGCGTTALLGSAAVIQVEPFWTPQYFIPLFGMLLGNSLTGLALGFDSALASLDEGRARIETLLGLGATWWEASRPVVADAVRTAMIPILNSMSAVGLVTIPGMMTGQILGGTEPGLASRYQILILFLIAASVALGAIVGTVIAVRALFDGQHRLRVERIIRRS